MVVIGHMEKTTNNLFAKLNVYHFVGSIKIGIHQANIHIYIHAHNITLLDQETLSYHSCRQVDICKNSQYLQIMEKFEK